MNKTTVRLPLIAAAGLALGVLSACGSSSSSTSSPSDTTSTTAASQPAAPDSSSAAPGGGSGGSGNAVTITETEFKIAMPSTSLTAGTYTFTVDNAGSITHALTIDGPGVEDKSTPAIDAGKSATLTVTLKPGTYDFYCPVGNHKMEGMDESVTVA